MAASSSRFIWNCALSRLARGSVVLSSLVFSWAGGAPADAGDVFYQKDGWTGAILTSDQKVWGCAARTSLEEVSLFESSPSQMNLAIAQSRDLRWIIAFSKPGGFHRHMRWSMELIIDGKSVHRGTAVVDQDGVTTLQPPLRERAVSAITGGDQLEIVTDLGRFTYSLRGSGDAIDATSKCIAALNAQVAPVTGTNPNPSDVRSLSAAESAEMLGKILNAAGLANFRLDPPTGEGIWVTFILADGTSGRFAAAVGSGTNADDYTATVIGKHSSYCKGDFMSGKQSVPSVDGSVVRIVTMTCRQGDSALVTEAAIIRRANGLLMVLSQIFPLSVNSTRPSPGEMASRNREALVKAAIQFTETR